MCHKAPQENSSEIISALANARSTLLSNINGLAFLYKFSNMCFFDSFERSELVSYSSTLIVFSFNKYSNFEFHLLIF